MPTHGKIVMTLKRSKFASDAEWQMKINEIGHNIEDVERSLERHFSRNFVSETLVRVKADWDPDEKLFQLKYVHSSKGKLFKRKADAMAALLLNMDDWKLYSETFRR